MSLQAIIGVIAGVVGLGAVGMLIGWVRALISRGVTQGQLTAERDESRRAHEAAARQNAIEEAARKAVAAAEAEARRAQLAAAVDAGKLLRPTNREVEEVLDEAEKLGKDD